MKYIYKHNGESYLLLRDMPEYSFKNKDGSFNRDVLIAWREYLGGDHVLKLNDRYLIVETLKDAQLIVNEGI